MKPYLLAIFDLAGTTVHDSNTVGACLQQALANVGVNASVSEVSAVMGIPKPVAIKSLLELHHTEGDVDSIHEEFRALMLDTYRTSPDCAEIPGTSEVFVALRAKGIKVAIDTGFDREITTVLLERLNWDGLVDDSITSDEVENGRPYPDMILELCERASVSPSQTIKIGDTLSDLKEGKAAGVGLNVGVLYGTHTESELLPYQPDALIHDIRELLTLDI